MGWWRRRNDDDTLFIFFEDLKQDLPRAVSKVAAFMGIAADPELVELVTAQASLPFMSEHVTKFDVSAFPIHSLALVQLNYVTLAVVSCSSIYCRLSAYLFILYPLASGPQRR